MVISPTRDEKYRAAVSGQAAAFLGSARFDAVLVGERLGKLQVESPVGDPEHESAFVVSLKSLCQSICTLLEGGPLYVRCPIIDATVSFQVCSFLNRLLKPRPVTLCNDLGLRRSGATRRSSEHRGGLPSGPVRAANPISQPWEDCKMSLETILIIVLLVFLLGGGGWYWGRGRGRG